MNTFKFETNLTMKSASHEAEEKEYTKHEGKSGDTWYIPSNVDNPADGIYVVTQNKEGMGGRTLKLKLLDGTVDYVAAPWHSNSGSLLEDTGIDITNHCHRSYVVCERAVPERPYGAYTCTGVIEYCDSIISSYEYPDERAKYYANKLSKRVYLVAASDGGSSAGHVYPDKED